MIIKRKIKYSHWQIFSICLLFSIASHCGRVDKNTIKDIDGNIYRTVEIGNYRWMAENLKTSTYNDGTLIPNVKDQSVWIRNYDGAYCWYNNNKSYADTFGLLYNWYSVNSGKICPEGWRIPTDDDWKYLEGYVDTKYGIGNPEWNKMGLRGYDAGKRLKAVSGWRPGITGTDDHGFSALPGGEHLSRFFAGGSSGFWWSSTEASASSAFYRNLIYSYELIARDTHPKRMGFSIRCIKEIP